MAAEESTAWPGVTAMAEHGLDNVLVTYGQAKNFAECFSDVGMCLRVDASTAVFDPSVPDNMPVFGIEDALRVGADGVVSLYVNDYNTPAMALYRSLGFEQVGLFATVLL